MVGFGFFPQNFLSQGCGSHVTITHNALDLGTYLPPPTWEMGTYPLRLLVTSGDSWRSYVQPRQVGGTQPLERSQIGTIQAVSYIEVRNPTEGQDRHPIRLPELPANDTWTRRIFRVLHSTVQKVQSSSVRLSPVECRAQSSRPVALVLYGQVVHSLSNKHISTVARLVVVKQT